MLNELFKTVTGEGWTTAGKDVQFKVINRVLYFQCTHGKSDWNENFKAGHDVYTCSDITFKAHDGFTELWLSVKEEIEKLEFDSIVGYSQGAALAGFAHENYFHRKGRQPITWTFGCPRFLYKPSKELKLRFTNFIRYKNINDIVTIVPPAIIGYHHVGKRKIMNHYVCKPKEVTFLIWLSGHCPEQYLQELKRE